MQIDVTFDQAHLILAALETHLDEYGYQGPESRKPLIETIKTICHQAQIDSRYLDMEDC